MAHTLRPGQREVGLGTPVTGNASLSHGYWRELTSSDVGPFRRCCTGLESHGALP